MGVSKYFVPSNSDKTRLSARVYQILQSHIGSHFPITGKEIAQALKEYDDRKVRICIGELIRAGVPVASSVGSNPGYYIVSNADEAASYIRVLESRIREDTERLNAFKEATKGLNVPQQSVLL